VVKGVDGELLEIDRLSEVKHEGTKITKKHEGW